MGNAYIKTRVIFDDYNDRIRYENVDHDEALQGAVSWALRGLTEEVKADTYAKISEAWQTYPIELHFAKTVEILRNV
jgi:hypothetical protein